MVRVFRLIVGLSQISNLSFTLFQIFVTWLAAILLYSINFVSQRKERMLQIKDPRNIGLLDNYKKVSINKRLNKFYLVSSRKKSVRCF